MPLPGGATDKFGNRYEGRWTVACMIDVMDERADSIRLEPPGQEGEGVEFWLRRRDIREYHQVKRQHGANGRWSLADLKSKNILSHFWRKLSEPTAYCVFISSHAAFQLDELADRASRSASWQEFYREFLNAGRSKISEQFHNFQELCSQWNNCSEIEAYEALKRIKVKTVDEDTLRTIVESRLTALVEGEPATVADVLAQYALDKVHYELTAQDIWHHLENRDEPFRRREWSKDPHVLAAVQDANNRYLSPLRDAGIGSKIIPRDEAQTVLQKLASPDSKRGVLLVGEAGVGKSGVMLQVLEALPEKGFSVLAFRVDRLEATLLPNDVGQQLGLPGSPANVLAAIAQKQDCVLIIDQLDAVSLASGRNPEFFDCVHEIIKEAQAHRRMHLVLACRKFDLDNDHRLRRLSGQDGITETVTISRLPHATVKKVVAELGLDAKRLIMRQLDLLSVPLHLSLLAEIAEDSTIDALSIETAKELYDQFWKRKQFLVRERLRRSIQWTQVVDALCDYMSTQQKQTLSVPEGIVDDYADDARAMASEHVLIWNGKRISFFHEGFFDYAFARRFAARGFELLSFLLSSEQHLFRRAQVRQILLHQREEDFENYLNNLRELLTSSNIRFHIKQVVFALLGALDEPTQEEWEIIASLMGDQSNPITQQVWRTLRSSVHWFQLLDSRGVIEKWLGDESEQHTNQAVSVLEIMQTQIPSRVAELVDPYVGVSEAWRKRLNWLTELYFAQLTELSAGCRRFFELFLQLIREGILDQEGFINDTPDFWRQIHSLPDKHPDWACEAISCHLNRYLDLSIAAGHPNLFSRHSGSLPLSHSYEEVLSKSARNAPRAYIKYILPFMLRVIELTAIREGNPPWHDPIWDNRTFGRGYNIDDALLSEMEIALSTLAANNPNDFAILAKQQLSSSNFETIQYLLIRVYADNGKRFADEAIDYLCEQPSRLKTGYLNCNGNRRAAPYWATCLLIEAVNQHCSQEKLVKLEAGIIDYYTDYEKTAVGRIFRGESQLILLNVINPSRRTQSATRRLQEWKRKFPDPQLLEPSIKIDLPESPEAWLVESPIPQDAADKMTDEQWLRAIARYDDNDDAGTRFQRTGKLIGGANQLSSLLKNQVKKETARFAGLIQKFPDNANSSYLDAVLSGLAEVGLDVETALQVCQRCHHLPGRPCGRSVSGLIENLANLPWSQEALDIVVWYALEDPNPATRGSAVRAIAALIFADKNRAYYFRQPLQQIVRDSSLDVKSCAAEALTAMLNYDRDHAVSLFKQLCEAEDALLKTQPIERFLYYTLQTYFEPLAPIVERMIMSEQPEVGEVGARQACLISLVMEEACWLAELCLCGTEAHKKAAAEIFATYLRRVHFREFCEDALIQLFHDSSEEVRSKAAKGFSCFEGNELGNYINLAEQFMGSSAFADGFHDLVWALEKTTAKLPELTYLVCEIILKNLMPNNTIRRRVFSGDVETVSSLLLRVYSQIKNLELQSQCLDIIDYMAQIGTYGLEKVLEQYER
jgi:hypothetical protein